MAVATYHYIIVAVTSFSPAHAEKSAWCFITSSSPSIQCSTHNRLMAFVHLLLQVLLKSRCCIIQVQMENIFFYRICVYLIWMHIIQQAEALPMPKVWVQSSHSWSVPTTTCLPLLHSDTLTSSCVTCKYQNSTSLLLQSPITFCAAMKFGAACAAS